MKFYVFFLSIFLLSCNCKINQIHVSKQGNDSNNGSKSAPLLTIGKAAERVKPGMEIVIHEGTYREFINPTISGTKEQPIIFRAAKNETVFIKGSERVSLWEKNKNGTWSAKLSNTLFDNYNPYTLNVDGDFQNYGQWHHRGDVYLNNGALNETKSAENVSKESYTWFATSQEETTTIIANFDQFNPNKELTEINVRELIFFALNPDVDYITIANIRFLHAAPNWQAPNTGSEDPNRLLQVGAVGCNMGKNWTIKNCEIMHSKTAGIMFGESADNQYKFENINEFGNHVIENCIISRCGEYGIAGQKGLSRSHIIGNRIENINYRNEFGGYEPAGIKIWNCSDVLIENNLIQHCIANQNNTSQAYCIWIDYANQGTRITRNFLVADSMTTTCLFLEANIGPTLVDNNIIIDRCDKNIQIFSGGTVLAHNLFINSNFLFQIQEFDNGGSGARMAYTLKPNTLIMNNIGHKVEIVNNKIYNNIFAGGNGPINLNRNTAEGSIVDFNIYINGTTPSSEHTNSYTLLSAISYETSPKENGIAFLLKMEESITHLKSPTINSKLIGIIPLAGQSIANENGVAITVNYDFNKKQRRIPNPIIGPLSNLKMGNNLIEITNGPLPTKGPIYNTPN